MDQQRDSPAAAADARHAARDRTVRRFTLDTDERRHVIRMAAPLSLVVLTVLTGLTGVGCKQAGDWAERRQASREAERQRIDSVQASEPAPVRARPTGPGLAPGTYRITEVRAEALPTNRKGRPWDDASGPEPELALVVRADGNELARCRAIENSLIGRCTLAVDVVIDAHTQLEVVVSDVDEVLDDRIGSARLTDPSTWGLGIELPLLPGDRLRAATIVLARPPSWWEIYRYQLIGLASGITAALALVAAFRGSLLAPRPAPSPAPRCQHCGIALPAHLVNCSGCGGIQTGPVS